MSRLPKMKRKYAAVVFRRSKRALDPRLTPALIAREALQILASQLAKGGGQQ